MILAMYFAHLWLFNSNGRDIATDFVNVWAAGGLAQGHPALAWDWDIHKQVQVAMLGQSYVGDLPGTTRHRSCSSPCSLRIFRMPPDW